MEIEGYIFSAILVAIFAISIILVIFCILRGKGIPHKILIFFTSLLCVVAMFCFGGNAILSIFGMGWRCKPFNTMLMLGAVLYIIMLCCCMGEFILFENANPPLIVCGFISLLFAILITLLSVFLYFNMLSWHDGLTTYNDQTIVYATDQHGGSAAWRYYLPINDLVHGVEITQDGWHGTRLWDLAS